MAGSRSWYEGQSETWCASCGITGHADEHIWYCNQCWFEWTKYRKETFLDKPLPTPVRHRNLTRLDFGGSIVHVVQIGLGTFGTFLHQDEQWVQIMLEATSWKGEHAEQLRGIGVDPLEEAAGLSEQLALERGGAAVLLSAVAQTRGEVSLFCLRHGMRQKCRQWLQYTNEYVRSEVDAGLAYLENMSSIETPHPDFMYNADKISKYVHCTDEFMEKRQVPVYTYKDILEMHNAAGCEVLIIDAEGADCAVLRSVIDACRYQGVPWPRAIRFETREIADYKEWGSVEEQTVQELQKEGYLLLDVGGDATLVYAPAMEQSASLAQWADKWFTLCCYSCRWNAFPSSPSFAYVVGSGYAQWKGTWKDQKFFSREWDGACRWCCHWCLRGN